MVLTRTLKNLGCALLLAFTTAVSAEVRHDNDYVWRRARPIASGQQAFSFQTSYQNFGTRFSDNGRVQPLGDPYARKLTWNRLLASDVAGTNDVRDYMARNGLKGEEIAATSSYEVDRQEVGFGLNWAYGLTQNWMVGVVVPIRFVTTRMRQNVQVEGAVTPAMRERLKQLADAELASDGFDQVPLQKQTWEFGDVSLLNQVEIARSPDWTWSVQQQLRFPTARSRSVAEYISFAEDQGSINLGFSSLLDYQFRKGVAGLRGGYVAQLADTVRMRGPGAGNGSAVDAHASRDLGDWFWGAVDGEVRIGRRVGMNLEHSFLTKARDRYAGDYFTADAYEKMADQSDQQLHQTRVGLLYKIGGLGSRLGERWMASVDYTYPWMGKNSSDAARTSFELINYF